jgi:hypothetical protein
MKNIIEISDSKLLESVTGGACECWCVPKPISPAISVGVKENAEECRKFCSTTDGYHSSAGCWGNGPLIELLPYPPLTELEREFLRQAWEAYPGIPPRPSK